LACWLTATLPVETLVLLPPPPPPPPPLPEVFGDAPLEVCDGGCDPVLMVAEFVPPLPPLMSPVSTVVELLFPAAATLLPSLDEGPWLLEVLLAAALWSVSAFATA
jgi:hypothetical protein